MKKFLKRVINRNKILYGIYYYFMKIKKGYSVYLKLKKRYGEDVHILVIPWPGTGDAFQTARYLESYLIHHNINNFLLITYKKSIIGLFNKLFDINDIMCVSQEDLFNLMHLKRFFYNIPQLDILHHNVPVFYSSTMEQLEGINGLSWEDQFVELGLFISKKDQVKLPKWEKGDLESIFKKNNLIPEKTVVIAPFANTFTENLSFECWQYIINKLEEYGFSICINTENNKDIEFNGKNIVKMLIPYEQLIPFLEYAGFVIAIRSGFCDIASMANCKKIFIYQSNKCGLSTIFSLFSLNKTTLCDDAIEFEFELGDDLYTCRKILNYFNIQEDKVSVKNENSFLISVIIPIYNTEIYLKDAVNSIINQNIGFEKNIQLILVNNGSQDNSDEICKKYKEIYPDNIVYIHLESNQGPNGARLAGLPYAKGKYVNFLDSDDKWSHHAFEQAISMLEYYGEKIDFVACRIKMFEGGDWFDWLDYKATHNHIVNILQNPFELHIVMASCIFNKKIFTKMLPSSLLKHCEDSTFLCECAMNKSMYGVCTAIYMYRIRNNGTSLCQTRAEDPSWYFAQNKHSFNYLINISKTKYGKVIEYIQHYIVRELIFHFEEPICSLFGINKLQQYIDELREILLEINDDIICKKNMPWEQYSGDLLKIKYNGLNGEDVQNRNHRLNSNLEHKSNIELANDIKWLYENGYLGFKYILKFIKGWMKYKINH